MPKNNENINSLIEEMKPLLNNLQKGINTFGIKGLNAELNTILSKDERRDAKIKIAVDVVCEDFKIQERALFRAGAKDIIKDARYICACLLCFELGLTVRVIGRYVFKQKQFGFVTKALSRHRNLWIEKIKEDKLYKERYDKLAAIINQKINYHVE